MKALRSTHYPAPGMPGAAPVTTTVSERDVRVPLEELARRTREVSKGILVIEEYFEVQDGASMPEIALEAMRRQKAREGYDRNMAIMYYWTANALRVTTAAGVLAQSRQSPLGAADVKVVLEQLALHPEYKGQVVVAFASDWTGLGMHQGKVATLPTRVRQLLEGRPEALHREAGAVDREVHQAVLAAVAALN